MNLGFSSYSPASYVQNKMRSKDWKRRINKVQTKGDRPNHMSSGFSKELNVQNSKINHQTVVRDWMECAGMMMVFGYLILIGTDFYDFISPFSP